MVDTQEGEGDMGGKLSRKVTGVNSQERWQGASGGSFISLFPSVANGTLNCPHQDRFRG